MLANSAFVPPHTSRAYAVRTAHGVRVERDDRPSPAPSEFTFCVFVKPFTAYHGTEPLDALVLEDFDPGCSLRHRERQDRRQLCACHAVAGRGQERGATALRSIWTAPPEPRSMNFSTSGFMGGQAERERRCNPWSFPTALPSLTASPVIPLNLGTLTRLDSREKTEGSNRSPDQDREWKVKLMLGNRRSIRRDSYLLRNLRCGYRRLPRARSDPSPENPRGTSSILQPPRAVRARCANCCRVSWMLSCAAALRTLSDGATLSGRLSRW